MCRYIASLALFLCLGVGQMWGAVYKTYSLSDLTQSSLTYEVTGLSSNDQKLNKGERKVEVPCASASGTLYLSGTGANASRYASIWGSNGTVVDATRKIAMTSGYGSGISFTSADILTDGGKYYIIFGNVDGTDYKINAFKYTLSAACGGGGCVVPTSVSVDATNANGWRYSIGETIDLTCTATGGTGTKTYQWQKYIGSSWTDIDGATNARFQKTNCTSSDGGSYRCVVSTGATCSLASDGYFIRVFTLNGNYSGSGFTENAIVWTGANTGVATVNLNASSKYEFKVYDNDGKIFGNGENNYIIQPVSWNCGTGNSNCNLYTGPAGNYTFTIDISHAQDGSPYVNVQVGYPSVSHPDAGYMYITKWWGTCYVHYWEGTNNALSTWGSDPALNSDRYVEICGTNYWYFPVIATYNKFIAKDAAGDPSNTTGDQVSTDHGGKYITHDGSSWGWHDFATYTITYAANGGGGSMSATSGICPDANQAITSNAFTAPSGCASFAHWTANVNVKVGGATVTAGNPIANGATIQNINSDITLTAVWKLAAPTITDNGDNTFSISGSMAGSSYYYTTNGGTPTTSSSLYSSAVDFSAGEADITAKAIAHKDGYVDSDVASQACIYHAADPCSEPAEVTNEIARFFVPCGLSNATSGEPSAWAVTNENASTGDNTFTTNGFGGGSSNWYRNEASGLIYGKLSGNSSYIQLKLKSGDFQTGDVVTAYFNRNNATKTGLTLKTQGSSYAITPAATAAEVETSGSYTLVADAIEADGSIKLFRANSSSFVNRIIVTRPACTNVSITTQPTTPVAATVGSACSITGLVAAGTSPTYQWYTCNSDGSGATAITSAGAMSFTGYTSATLGLTPTAAGATYYKCVVSGSCGDPVTSNVVTVNASAAETPIITWEMKLTSGQNWGLNGDPSTTDNTNITSISANNTHAAQLDGKTANGTMTAGCTTAQNGTARDNNIYVEFKFQVGCDKKLTPSKISLQVSNIGGSSDGNMTYDAILTDGTRTVSGSVTPASDGTLTTLEFTNADASKYMQGDVTLRVYPYNNNGGNTGSGFRMGQYVKIFGEIANQATPAATITWNTQPANGRVGDPDFAYDVTCSDGSAVTVTSNNTSVATIVGGKLHYAAAGTTYLVASATDACGNAIVQNSNNFTVSVPATYDVTFSLTNVVYSSGDNQGTDAATEGSAFSTVFAANSGYDIPSTITVTIGGAAATAGTDYTWNSSTGAFEVPAAKVTGDIVVTIVGPEHVESECVTITTFSTSNTTISQSSFVRSIEATDASSNTYLMWGQQSSFKGQNSGANVLLYNNTAIRIFAGETSSDLFSNVVGVSFKWRYSGASSSTTTTLKVYVGSTQVGTAAGYTVTGTKNDAFETISITGISQLSGYIQIAQSGGSGTGANLLLDDIEICTADMDACTTPTIPTLTNQDLCSGIAASAWNATVSNAAAIEAAGESVSYKWQKKNGSNWDDISGATSATYDVDGSGTVTEAMAGTYRVVVTVTKAGKSSTTANKEVTLSVTEATEVTGITANKATVYPGNSVTLTATANTTVTWQWYTCTNAEGAGESSISGEESAAYTISSAGSAGTYYYKVKGTSSCGTDEMVYTLTVSAAAGGDCETEFWFAKAADKPESATTSTHITGTPSGSSGASYTASVDGNDYTISGSTGQKTGNVTIVVPENKEGALYVVVQGSSSRTITLSKGGVQVGQETPANSTWGTFTFSSLDAGTYTLVSSGNISWGLLALKLCSATACSDPEVTASADNTTVCVGSSVTFTAANAHASATYQWQKYSGSAWGDISGAASSTYTINPVAAGDAGKYRVIASHDCNRTSNEVTLTVAATPVFGDITSPRTVMETQALSISDVEASDATGYKWYKSANNTYEVGTDVEVGTAKNLILASGGETSGATYYLFCVASNSCGSVTSSAITVNVTAYVEEDCAAQGNEGEAEFVFTNTGSVGTKTYNEKTAWRINSGDKYLTYSAPEGKYLASVKFHIAHDNDDNGAYAYSTDNGSTWTYARFEGLTTSWADKTINLSVIDNTITDFRIGRKLSTFGNNSGSVWIYSVCFEYSNKCTSTTVTPSTSSTSYALDGGSAWSNPTFSLSPAAVSGETLTYSSSNEDIATVDDDGTVTFQGLAGTVTITASYAGDATYCASQGSYIITVSCSDERPKIVAGSSVNLSGCNSEVVLNAKMQDGTSDFSPVGTYQWYRNGGAISGATSASYTARQAGTYTVERTGAGGCTNLSSNSAVITSETTEPEVERLVPFQYYHVDKTYTAFMKMRHLFTVKGSSAYGSTGKNFKMELQRNGGDATDVTTSNAFSVVKSNDNTVDTVMIDLNKLSGKYAEGDKLLLTCKAVDCNNEVSNTYKDTITIRVIGSTPTLALICSGSDKEGGTRSTDTLTVGGDFLTGYNKADLCEQTGKSSFDKNTEWGLYTRLKANYIVTSVNGYAPFNKLNYEPFDILLLTDYPKASKSNAAKDILDDMADLCDYRPMLSFKAHMVAKTPSKWAAKGFTTEPVAVKQGDGRTHLNIVCYAHPMFDGIKDAGEHIFKDNDATGQIVYEMLTGPGHESSKGIQGFEIAAAENFVTIGLIHFNASVTENSPSSGLATWAPTMKDGKSLDRTLVAAVERQTNPEARMIVLAVNCGAQSKFTETGRTIVHKCLQYLLSDYTITPMADCSFTFDNGAHAPHDADWYKDEENCPGCTGELGDGKWSTQANWGPDYILRPGKDTEVKIAAPVTVDMTNAVARSARIVEGGHITIPAGSALEVTGTIRHMDGTEISPTENSDIFIGSTASGNGTLIFNNDKGDSKATVAMYTTAKADTENMSAATSTWQYIGTPHNDVVSATYNYYDSWLYQYDTSTEGWVVIPNGGPLVPFRGYCVTHPQTNHTFEMYGKLAATTSADIAIPAGKFVVAANSWVAPIDLNKLTDDDMENITDKTIYFFNTGSDAEQSNGTGTAPGTYVAAPIHASAYTGDWQIPSMQGFYVVGGGSDGTLHLDYDRHVRPTESRSIVSNPMHAPRRYMESDEPEVAKLYFRGSRYSDRLVVLEREDFTRGYDSGWDGEAWGGNDAAPYSCVSGENRWDAVSAIPDFEGTVVGFQAGEDHEYIIDFEYSEENEPLYLLDMDNNTYTQVVTGNAYQFTTDDKDYHDRFIFTRKAPQIATGIEPTSDSSLKGRARKLLIEDKMYILLNGMLYDATGKVVK